MSHLFHKLWLPFVERQTPKSNFPTFSSDKNTFNQKDRGYAIGTKNLIAVNPIKTSNVSKFQESLMYGWGNGIKPRSFEGHLPAQHWTTEEINNLNFGYYSR